MANNIWHNPPVLNQGAKPVVRPPAALQRQLPHTGVRFAPVPNVRPAVKSPASAQTKLMPAQGVKFAPVPNVRSAVKWPSSAQTKLISPPSVKFAPVPNVHRRTAANPASPRMAVQRYKIVPVASQSPTNYGLNYDLRVSDDGKMAVKDTGNATPNGSNQFQDLYLAPTVFNASNQVLTNANSGVTLTQTATTITGKPPGNYVNRTLHLVSIQYADTPNNESYEGCNANAWNLMGTVRNAQPSATVTHGYFKSKINGSKWVASQADDGGALKGVRNKITGLTASQSRVAWGQLDDDERESAAKKYGINQFAKPKAGEAIAIFNTDESSTKQGMGHWAGVVASSGGDYITLENYAGNPGGSLHGNVAVNSNWYVRMFGSKTGQSFYEFHKTHEAADYASEPIAIRYQAR